MSLSVTTNVPPALSMDDRRWNVTDAYPHALGHLATSSVPRAKARIRSLRCSSNAPVALGTWQPNRWLPLRVAREPPCSRLRPPVGRRAPAEPAGHDPLGVGRHPEAATANLARLGREEGRRSAPSWGPRVEAPGHGAHCLRTWRRKRICRPTKMHARRVYPKANINDSTANSNRQRTMA